MTKKRLLPYWIKGSSSLLPGGTKVIVIEPATLSKMAQFTLLHPHLVPQPFHFRAMGQPKQVKVTREKEHTEEYLQETLQKLEKGKIKEHQRC